MYVQHASGLLAFHKTIVHSLFKRRFRRPAGQYGVVWYAYAYNDSILTYIINYKIL